MSAATERNSNFSIATFSEKNMQKCPFLIIVVGDFFDRKRRKVGIIVDAREAVSGSELNAQKSEK